MQRHTLLLFPNYKYDEVEDLIINKNKKNKIRIPQEFHQHLILLNMFYLIELTIKVKDILKDEFHPT